MIDYRCKLYPGKFYHVYNRGIDGCTLFHDKGNYRFFLSRYADYMPAVVDTYAWCLMPNHFHFLIGVKDVSHLQNAKHLLQNAKYLNDPSAAFQRLFTSYSKALNKQQGRHGSLFEKPFRRIEVNSSLYQKQLVVYIHNNPIHHGFVISPEEWEFSSFHNFIHNEISLVRIPDVIEWFEDEENFRFMHKQKITMDNELILE